MDASRLDQVAKKIASSRLSRRLAIRRLAAIGVGASVGTGVEIHQPLGLAAQTTGPRLCCVMFDVVTDAVDTGYPDNQIDNRVYSHRTVVARICPHDNICPSDW